MLLIPAIDLKEGKCVRLRQGRMDEVTVFSDDPVAMAGRWIETGAQRLHVVDLDGAVAGRPVNTEIIGALVESFPEVPVQVGGGIRDVEDAEAYLDAGVRFIIVGTRAVREPHFVKDLCVEFPGRVIVGLDARDGRVAVDGWSKLSRHDVVDLAQQFERDGVEAIVYTDIGRDGMLNGVNTEATRRLAQAITIPVIASGGVSTLEDIRALCAIEGEGVCGAIIGRALYEGTLDLAAAQRLVDGD
ncbi:MAG: 1-(5-phosphoribosyl)-5-[(5-phosphoribosylamino)methylideneamino]imidazole-4-carboxamide isomerase [Candidatus Competibacterales bacterium]|nr:1-(5-phosphoribosyl)-5-[(5-phosphoribosylamino)methylideneamino]imidazole-4-carboxamide isomerase [Candidatus Competibacterales bacterium]